MTKTAKHLFNFLLIGASTILVSTSANSAPFGAGCKAGGFDQPKQECDVYSAKAKLNGKPGEIVTYKFRNGYTVKRFISGDFSFEMANLNRFWSSATWEVSNPNSNECSLIYKDPMTAQLYPILTTYCGD